MQFKTIVAILQNEQDTGRVLDCAIPLASRSGGHIIGIHAEALPVSYTAATGFPDTQYLQVSAEINKQRTDSVHAAFLQRIERAGISFEWHAFESFSGDSALSGVASARCADLVISAQHEGDDDPGSDVDSLIYDAGRPVLIVPSTGTVTSGFKRVLLAWNGSKEAARAAFDALPLMIAAENTEILLVDPLGEPDKSPDAAGVEIAAALARHGVKVNVCARSSDGMSIEDLIQERLVESDADLLVLGAYSHSWLRQLLFGGVTRSVLRSLPVAAFLSR